MFVVIRVCDNPFIMADGGDPYDVETYGPFSSEETAAHYAGLLLEDTEDQISHYYVQELPGV